MKKNLIFILALSIILCMSSTSVYAEDVLVQESNDGDIIVPMQLYEYIWQVTSTTANPITYGTWADGPTGLGPGNLDINESSTISREYTNSITGEYTIGKSKIAASLGTTIGIDKTYGTSYSITLADGERKTIKFRPKLRVYKVISTYYRYPVGLPGEKVAIDTETCYVTTFVDWDYSWRYGY
ncbi:MAG: hypothetical protein WBI07_02695 [Mobilitalea sp.]